MSKFRLVEVGDVRKTHGYAGELKINVEVGFEDLVEEAQYLYIGKTLERAIPYRVVQLRGADWIFKLEELSNKEDAGLLRGQGVYVQAPADFVTPAEEMDKDLQRFKRFEGYTLADGEGNEVGEILNIDLYPGQLMAAVDYQGREVMIPLHDNLILAVELNNKRLLMNLPEGLLDL